jgi:hypothetical protein
MTEAVAKRLCETYEKLDTTQKERFFEIMAIEFGINVERVHTALRGTVKQLEQSSSDRDKLPQLYELRKVMRPEYERFL